MRDAYSPKLVQRAREMRREQTAAERRLWLGYLQRLPVRVRRQCPLHGYVLDFYIHSRHLVIELDGASHDTPEAQTYDAHRTAVLEAAGLRVLRFGNADVFRQFQAVCGAIEAALEGNPPPPAAEPPSEGSAKATPQFAVRTAPLKGARNRW